MRIITNQPFIEKREKAANILPLVAMGVLVISLVLSFIKPDWFLITMVIVLIGFFLSITGTYYVHRFASQLAPHKEIPKVLKGFDDEYALLIYKVPHVPFVLVEPGGLTAILVKLHGGEVTYEDGQWHHNQRLRLLRQFGGEEALGRPDRQARELADLLETYVEARLPEGVEAPVRAIVLFLNPEVQLEADEAPMPALWVGHLKDWLRNEGRRQRLPAKTRQAIAAALGISDTHA
ncbi:MAG: hypothetical protein ACP5HM_15355 [Anaerolineae bacterium]